MGRYRYIYLPPPKPPLFGSRIDHMVQIPHDFQLNKIRILFNSLLLYMHIYTYTYAYQCISCIHGTESHLHLSLKPDCYTIYKRIQARIRSTVYAAPHSQAPERELDMPGKAPKKCGYRAHLYALYMVGFSHSAQKNRLHNG